MVPNIKVRKFGLNPVVKGFRQLTGFCIWVVAFNTLQIKEMGDGFFNDKKAGV